MTIYIKELKQSVKAWAIWTCSIAFLVFICIMMFPEMKSQVENVSNVFANLGSFTAAFGMDKLSIGELMGFYGIECGNIIGIGGGLFAALAGISVLACEEKDRTAEFLLTHPVSRASVLSQKLLSVITQVTLMNIAAVAVSLVTAAAIGEKFEIREFILLHTAYLFMQLEIAFICFGISAFIRRGSIGIGLGLALAFYFMNIVCNISESAEFLKLITPYAYAGSGKIISEAELDPVLICTGAAFSLAGILIGYLKYTKKDIAA